MISKAFLKGNVATAGWSYADPNSVDFSGAGATSAGQFIFTVQGSSTPLTNSGTIVHTVPRQYTVAAGASGTEAENWPVELRKGIIDEVWLFASNNAATSGSIISLEVAVYPTASTGGTAQSLIRIDVPAGAGLVTVLPGIPLTSQVDSENVTLRCRNATDSTNTNLVVMGYVNRTFRI
jgi:hypothetical protein